MSNQIYVIVAASFEYNDNYYYRTDGGHPQKYYTDVDAASKACQELNDAARKNCDPKDYDQDECLDNIEFYYVVTLPLG